MFAISQGCLLPSDGFCSRTLPIRPRHPLLLAPLLAKNEGVKCSRESSSPNLSPFRQFEDEVLDRIAHAQANEDCSSKIGPEEVRLPFVDCCYIEQLAGSISRCERSDEMEHGLANGYFLLKLNENDSRVMGDLWGYSEEIFSLDEIPLRHQTLVRDSATTNPDASGYKYIETTRQRCDGTFVLLPDDGIENTIGKDGKDSLSKAYKLLENIGRLTTTALLKASMAEPHATAIDDLMALLPDSGQVSEQYGEEDSALSCTMQRICCYSSLPRGEGLDERETLRAHADWSILTLVPISVVPGLEVWDSQLSTWIRPEDVDKVSTEHNHYIVVMAGKWLELLSMGRIPAVIHRVIASKGSNRLSTPLFYRPRQHIPLLLQEKYGTMNIEIKETPQEDMGKFLFELLCGSEAGGSKY